MNHIFNISVRKDLGDHINKLYGEHVSAAISPPTPKKMSAAAAKMRMDMGIKENAGWRPPSKRSLSFSAFLASLLEDGLKHRGHATAPKDLKKRAA